MRIHGWCEKCHKIRLVRVKYPMPGRNVQTGICAACEEKEYERRKGDG